MAQAQAQHSTPQGALDTALGPFATLSIWREKLQADLSEPGADQLRLLLQQGTDVEQAGARAGGWGGGGGGWGGGGGAATTAATTAATGAHRDGRLPHLSSKRSHAVLGCLKDALFDLHEGVSWGLLDPACGRRRRQVLHEAAAAELDANKQLCLQLAREHGVLGPFSAAVKARQPGGGGRWVEWRQCGGVRWGGGRALVWCAPGYRVPTAGPPSAGVARQPHPGPVRAGGGAEVRNPGAPGQPEARRLGLRPPGAACDAGGGLPARAKVRSWQGSAVGTER